MKSLWILSEERSLELQKTLDTLTQTSDLNNLLGSGLDLLAKTLKFAFEPLHVVVQLFPLRFI